MSDNMKGGAALHPRLIEDYRPFLDARSELSQAVRALRDALDERALTLLEEQQGKSATWHKLNVMRKARMLLATMPKSANPSADQLKTFDGKLDDFVQAVKGARSACMTTAAAPSSSEANSYIGKLRSVRRNYGQRTAEMTLDSDMMSLDIAVSMMANNMGAEKPTTNFPP